MNIVSPLDTELDYKAIYVNTTSTSANYRSWSKETISPNYGSVDDVKIMVQVL